MTKKAQQLPLDLITTEAYGIDDLIITEANEAVYEALRAETWVHPHLMLVGPQGSGKTYFGHVFASQSGAAYVPPNAQTHDLQSLERRDVALDDADQADEALLFHLFNSSLANNKRLLLLSRKHPREWRPALPDLTSRLNSVRVIDMPEPDEALLKGLLIKLFARRAISPSPEFIEFLSRRMERSVEAAQKIVTEIDHYASGRPFNRALAKAFTEDTDFLDKSENLSWLNEGDAF